jgi:hypothetical protein
MRTALATLESSGNRFVALMANSIFVDVAALAGDSRTAQQAKESATKAGEAGQRWGSEILHGALSIVAAQQIPPNWEIAKSEIETAIHESKSRTAQPLGGIALFRYAEILHKKGDLGRALEQLAEAEKLFAEMEMTWWSEQAAGLRARIEGGKPFIWFAPYVDGPPQLD